MFSMWLRDVELSIIFTAFLLFWLHLIMKFHEQCCRCMSLIIFYSYFQEPVTISFYYKNRVQNETTSAYAFIWKGHVYRFVADKIVLC